MIRVVLADDHAVLRDGLTALLETQPDFKVVGTASDGDEALRQINALLPDVVVMDIAMPKLNGIEATQRIRTQALPCRVIVLSMHANAEYVHRTLQAGAQGYLLKESAGTDLIQAIRAVHAGEQYLGTKVTEIMIDSFLHPPQIAEDLLATLSPREIEVLKLVVRGKTSKTIALALSISPTTVDTYRSRIMTKLGLDNLPDLVKFAIQHRLLPFE